MSSAAPASPPAGATAVAPADPVRSTLFAGLIDDAAVFPPGNQPLPDAVAAHVAMRAAAWYAPLVGPLLLPAAGVPQMLSILGAGRLAVGLIARPGSPTGPLLEAAAALAGTGVRLSAVEAGWQPDWRSALGVGEPGPFGGAVPPLALEIPRGPDRDRALSDLVAARAEGLEVVAKLRTGATPTWAWPDEDEVAEFLLDVTRAGLPFKLTGGLHHLVRSSEDPNVEPQHGLLNVIAALDAALDPGPGSRPGAGIQSTGRESLRDLLRVRHRVELVERTRALSAGSVARIRGSFRSYGCCTVTDPIDELVATGLLGRPGPSVASGADAAAAPAGPRPEGVC